MRWFKNYVLVLTRTTPRYYYPNLVHGFYASYKGTLEKNYKKGKKIRDFPNLNRVQVRRVQINIFYQTIDNFLYGSNLLTQTIIASFGQKMMDRNDYLPWLAKDIAKNVK